MKHRQTNFFRTRKDPGGVTALLSGAFLWRPDFAPQTGGVSQSLGSGFLGILDTLFDPILLSLLALSLALVAAWAVWRFRQESPLPAEQPTEPRPGRETATRIDTPVTAVVGAFLEVARGDETLVGKMIPLYVETSTVAGRSLEKAELVFNLHSSQSVVSRLHCEFVEVNGIYRVRDLGSTQGTYLNGLRLSPGGEGQILLEGDRLELGPAERGGVVLIFHSASLRLVRQVLN